LLLCFNFLLRLRALTVVYTLLQELHTIFDSKSSWIFFSCLVRPCFDLATKEHFLQQNWIVNFDRLFVRVAILSSILIFCFLGVRLRSKLLFNSDSVFDGIFNSVVMKGYIHVHTHTRHVSFGPRYFPLFIPLSLYTIVHQSYFIQVIHFDFISLLKLVWW